jgi:hypothetical protein
VYLSCRKHSLRNLSTRQRSSGFVDGRPPTPDGIHRPDAHLGQSGARRCCNTSGHLSSQQPTALSGLVIERNCQRLLRSTRSITRQSGGGRAVESTAEAGTAWRSHSPHCSPSDLGFRASRNDYDVAATMVSALINPCTPTSLTTRGIASDYSRADSRTNRVTSVAVGAHAAVAAHRPRGNEHLCTGPRVKWIEPQRILLCNAMFEVVDKHREYIIESLT